MVVIIEAYEQMYGGLHGIEDIEIMKVKDISEAMEIGRQMSYDLIQSYGLEEIYLRYEDLEDMDDYEFSECLDEIVEENLGYNAYRIIMSESEEEKLSDKDLRQWTENYYNDRDEFKMKHQISDSLEV